MVNVHVGEDGTNDSVTIEICSDMDSDCCTKMLDSFFNDFTSMFEIVLLREAVKIDKIKKCEIYH